MSSALRYKRPYWFQMYRVYPPPPLEDEYHPQGTCSNGGAVVRALASHQCGPDSNPGVSAICGLSLFVVGSLLCSEVFVWVLQFSPLLKNQHFQILIRSGTHGHV